MQHERTLKEIEYCKYLGRVIKNLRKKKGMSLNCLAFDSFLSASTVCRIENNQNTPQITKIAQIAYGLGMPMSELIAEVEKELPHKFILSDD